jgi:hypothetical protein
VSRIPLESLFALTCWLRTRHISSLCFDQTSFY